MRRGFGREWIAGGLLGCSSAILACGDDGSTADGVVQTGGTSMSADSGGDSGSEAAESSSGAIEVDYLADIQPVWEGNCLCHVMNPSGVMTAEVLTLNADVSYEQLVGAASEQVPELDRVQPGSLEDSYLWRKIEGTHEDVGGSGTAMPPGLELDEADLMVLEAWILGGAEP